MQQRSAVDPTARCGKKVSCFSIKTSILRHVKPVPIKLQAMSEVASLPHAGYLLLKLRRLTRPRFSVYCRNFVVSSCML